MSTTPTPAPSGGSNFDQVGAALASEPSQAETSTSTETTTEAEQPQEATETTTTEPEVKAEEPTEPKAEPESNPYEQDDETDVPPQTLNTLLQTDRGRLIYQSHKTLREFQKPLEQGGIGHVPSVEQIRDYYGSYRDRVIMDHDLASGNPQQAERMLNFLFDPQRGAGTNLVASQLAPTLAKLNPETYAAAAQPFITNYAGALYERYQQARDSGDEKLRSALWYAANVANYDMTGEWLKDQPPAMNAGGQQADPLAEQRAALAAERAEIDRARQEQAQQQANSWRESVTANIGKAVYGEIDKALIPLKSSASPRIYEALRKEFHDNIVAKAANDRHAWDLYNVKVAQARRDPNIDLAAEYVRLVSPVIKAERKKFLEEAGVTVMQQNNARHDELRQVDQHKGLSNGAGTPGAPKGPQLVRDYGESQRDFNLRQFKALTG